MELDRPHRKMHSKVMGQFWRSIQLQVGRSLGNWEGGVEECPDLSLVNCKPNNFICLLYVPVHSFRYLML